MKDNETIENLMNEFCHDRTSGSLNLLEKALTILIKICENGINTDEMVRAMLSLMRECHGDMSIITNAAAEAEELIRRFEDNDYPEKLIEYAKGEMERITKSFQATGDAVASIIKREIRAGTISRSQTVLRVLASLHEKGLLKNVVISESRPMREGVKMALEMWENGISVTIVADAAMDAMLENVDLCIIGADSVDESGNVRNKIGSRSLALSCRNRKIPFVVVCQQGKVTNSLPGSREQHDRNELVYEDLPENIEVSNFYFENVERDLIDFIVIGDRIVGKGETL